MNMMPWLTLQVINQSNNPQKVVSNWPLKGRHILLSFLISNLSRSELRYAPGG